MKEKNGEDISAMSPSNVPVGQNAFESGRNESTFVEAVKMETSTTGFKNDAEVSISQPYSRQDFTREYLDTGSSYRPQDILEFLRKPYPIQTGSFASTDTATTFNDTSVPGDILSLDIFKQKIKGHLGFRGTAVFRLQVNGNRFQQGRYMLFFVPGRYFGFPNATQYNFMHTFSLTQATQLPHVEVDIACDTEAILKVPYSSYLSHWSILDANSSGAVGTVKIRPYSPLSTAGGSTTADFTLWVHFEDVELVGPTLSQMAGDTKVRKNKMSLTSSEQRKGGMGPISSVAKIIGNASSVLEEVPYVSNVAGMVTWASDIVSGVASAFGWSNPLDLDNVHRMVQTVFPFSLNCDMPDESMPLSLFGRNEVEVVPGANTTGLDEMDLKFISNIPSYYTTFNFTESNAEGDRLFSQSLTPAAMYQTLVDSTVSTRSYTPIGWLSTMFKQWRGSLVFRFKVVKTEFHTGRLILSYAPSHSTHADWAVTDTPYLHREILDLRYGNEFTFCIPYNSLIPYRACEGGDSYGKINLHVLNTLKAPASVPSTVTFLVEVFGSDDFEFAIPRAWKGQPYLPTAVAQMDSEEDSKVANSCEVGSGIIGSAIPPVADLVFGRYCIGERVTSLLQLLKKNSYWGIQGGGTANVSWRLAYNALNFTGNVTNVATNGLMQTDNYGYICSAYAYVRGSVRIRGAYNTANAGEILRISYGAVEPGAGGIGSLSNSTFGPAPGNLTLLQTTDFRKGFEVASPFYNSSALLPNQFMIENPSSNLTVGGPTGSVRTNYVNATTATNTYLPTFYRKVGDDFQAVTFTSIPPIYGETM